jgi:RimJ/RimL family protein N-acetyltransferase
MAFLTNDLGQPIGPSVTGWSPPPVPPHETMEGRWCWLEPMDPDRHSASLYDANSLDREGRSWTYLPYGPFSTLADYRAWMEEASRSSDPLYYAVLDRSTGRAAGVASYLRIDPRNGCIEVGHINYSPLLQRTTAATEAMYLMMERVFSLGYRRYEWKCDALNAPSRAAAERLGLSFEGVFRQATIYKGRSRDTAWYSVIDKEWPRLQTAFLRWLDPFNFDPSGRQKLSLSDLTRPLLHRAG